MFRYTIALGVWFSGKQPTIEEDVAADLPMHGHLTITLAYPINIVAPNGGQMSLPAGAQISGTIVGKPALPQGGNP
jgi:hypothetical protein